jgi:chaperonin GroEL (HSP60 family)
LDPIDTLLLLVAEQVNGGSQSHQLGLDVIERKPVNAVENGVLEPYLITRQSIAGATEAAISILRIDDVLWAKQDPSMPEMPDME